MTYWNSQLDQISGTDIKMKFTSSDGATKFMNLTPAQFIAVRDVLLSIEEPEEQEQRVVFRKFPHNGEIIALFPDQYNKRNGNIGSYMHNGQHAETAPDFGDTKPAQFTDYYVLYAELVEQGYKNLNVVKRITIRKNQL